jgi:hypothetical protein
MRSKASVARLRLCVAKKARLASHFLLRKKKPEAMKQQAVSAGAMKQTTKT